MEFIIPGVFDGILVGGSYALAALGLSLVFGIMRVVNMANGDFMVLSAYLAYALVTASGMDPLLTLVIVAPVMFVFGYCLQATLIHPVLNRGLEAGLVTTFGIALILQNSVLSVFTSNPRSLKLPYATSGISLAGVQIPIGYLLDFGIAVVVCLVIHLLFTKTSFGRKARAASENANVAALMGVDVKRIYRMMFGLAGGLCAIAGVVMAATFSFSPVAGTNYLIKGFAVVVLGGLGNVFGTLVAGLMIGGIEGLGTTLFGGGYRDFVTYVIFLIILIIRPHGLAGGETGQ